METEEELAFNDSSKSVVNRIDQEVSRLYAIARHLGIKLKTPEDFIAFQAMERDLNGKSPKLNAIRAANTFKTKNWNIYAAMASA